jgi:hypothetical protein
MTPKNLKKVLVTMVKDRAPILIVGAPGIGKSDIVNQVATETKMDLIIEHPVVSDPTDYKGFPFPNQKDGTAEFLPFGNLQRIITAKKPTIYFLDDLGQAPASVQAACMQLILARQINGKKVSDKVTFIAATNRRSDKAGVSGLLEPVKSRFTAILNLTVDVDNWIEWAIDNDLPMELIAFVQYRPHLLHDFKPTNDLVNTPSPRTVANVGRLMKMNLPKEMEFECFAGAAGEIFAAEFVGFLRIYRTLPDPDLIVQAPDSVSVPTDPATLYAICGALAEKANEKTINNLVKYYDKLPNEFSVLAMLQARQKNPKIQETSAWIKWATNHQDILL